MFANNLIPNTIIILKAVIFISLLSVYLSNGSINIPTVGALLATIETSGSDDGDDSIKASSSNIEEEKCYKDKKLQISQQNESGSNTIGDIRVNNEEGICLEINSNAEIKTDDNMQQTINDDNNDVDNEQNCVGNNSRCTGISQQSESGSNEIGDINLD